MKNTMTVVLFALAFAGCGGAFQSGVTSKSTYTVKDGVHVPQEVTYEQNMSGQAGGSVGLPMGIALGGGGMGIGGGGYGMGGFGMFGGGMIPMQGCSVNPAMCRQIVTTPIYSGGGVSYVGMPNTRTDGAVTAKLDRIEHNVENLRCAQITQMAGTITDPAKREKAISSCREFVKGDK